MVPRSIILHHSATKDGITVSWSAIRRYHIQECQWLDIGYHAGIELVGDQYGPPHYEILFGRMWDEPGAHTTGRNNDSLGLCFVGNFDLEEPPKDQWDLGLKLVRLWMKLYGIPKDEILGHRQCAHKTCPGLKFDLERFKVEL
jgi:N-acetylmuramoyl-L-alanine amidase